MQDIAKDSSSRRILPPTYLLTGLLLMLSLHFMFPLVEIIPRPWILLGFFPIAIGIWINLIADRLFKDAQTTIQSFGEPSQMVVNSVYGFSRNPMYLGMVLVLLGVALLLGSLTSFFVIPVFIGLMNRVFIKFEESMMEEQFGRSWVEYTLRVRRWI